MAASDICIILESKVMCSQFVVAYTFCSKYEEYFNVYFQK